MKRAVIFLLLGPVSAAFAAFLAGVAMFGLAGWGYAVVAAVFMYLLSVPFSACVGCVDGSLSRVLPLASRAPLSALFAGALAFGLIRSLGLPIPELSLAFAMGAAVCAGLCSLFSDDRGRQQSAVPAGAGR